MGRKSSLLEEVLICLAWQATCTGLQSTCDHVHSLAVLTTHLVGGALFSLSGWRCTPQLQPHADASWKHQPNCNFSCSRQAQPRLLPAPPQPNPAAGPSKGPAPPRTRRSPSHAGCPPRPPGTRAARSAR